MAFISRLGSVLQKLETGRVSSPPLPPPLLRIPHHHPAPFTLTPSSPNSFVNLSCTSRSSFATVGLARSSTFLKSLAVMFGGITFAAYPRSASCSNELAHACGSPGEHGTYCSEPSACGTVLKCVASCTFRTGS